VRLDLVEKLAEAIESDAPSDDVALARLIGRPVRELVSILNSLGYHQAPAEEGRPTRWRRSKPKRKGKVAAAQDNAFSALANLLPPTSAPPRRRRGGPS
jgi:hypothetical protein